MRSGPFSHPPTHNNHNPLQPPTPTAKLETKSLSCQYLASESVPLPIHTPRSQISDPTRPFGPHCAAVREVGRHIRPSIGIHPPAQPSSQTQTSSTTLAPSLAFGSFPSPTPPIHPFSLYPHHTYLPPSAKQLPNGRKLSVRRLPRVESGVCVLCMNQRGEYAGAIDLTRQGKANAGKARQGKTNAGGRRVRFGGGPGLLGRPRDRGLAFVPHVWEVRSGTVLGLEVLLLCFEGRPGLVWFGLVWIGISWEGI